MSALRTACRVVLPWVVVALPALLSGAGAETPGRPDPTPPWEILVDRPLPPPLAWATDLRWAPKERAVWVTSPVAGLFQWHVDQPEEPPSLSIQGGHSALGRAAVFTMPSLFLPTRLAVSERFLVAGSFLFVVSWLDPSGADIQGRFPVESTLDLDLAADRLLLLGARRAEDGRMSPDGAIAWLGSLDKGLRDLEPVLYSTSGPGARALNACGVLEPGAVRFLADGSFVIAPGVEPEVSRFDPQGKLLRTWSAETVGVDGRCGLSDEEMYRVSRDLDARWAEMNRRRLIDEILPLPQGPGLIVRSATPAGTRWELKILGQDGSVASREIPITSPSGLAHLRGDVRGDTVVFLVAEYGHPSQRAAPQAPPRLVLATVPR